MFFRPSTVRLALAGGQELLSAFDALQGKSRWACSVALNETANAGQQLVRSSLPQRFKLRRRTFVERTIYRQPGVDFATRRDLRAAVRVRNTPQGKSVPDFLAQHEERGTKGPRSGRNVAIPIDVPRTGQGGVVTTRWRPAALKADPKVARIKGPRGDLLVRFSGRGRGARAVVLYLLRARVRLAPRLHFVATMNAGVRDAWPDAAAGAIDRAIAEAFARSLAG